MGDEDGWLEGEAAGDSPGEGEGDTEAAPGTPERSSMQHS